MEPNPLSSRLAQTPKEIQTQEERQVARSGSEFASAEEMLRTDAAQTPPPESIEIRLKTSIAKEPPRPRSWWRKLFGSGAGGT